MEHGDVRRYGAETAMPQSLDSTRCRTRSLPIAKASRKGAKQLIKGFSSAARAGLPRFAPPGLASLDHPPLRRGMSWFLSRSTELRREPGRPQGVVVDIPQRDGHHLAGAVDRDMAEELQAEARRQILSLLLA